MEVLGTPEALIPSKSQKKRLFRQNKGFCFAIIRWSTQQMWLWAHSPPPKALAPVGKKVLEYKSLASLASVHSLHWAQLPASPAAPLD